MGLKGCIVMGQGRWQCGGRGRGGLVELEGCVPQALLHRVDLSQIYRSGSGRVRGGGG